MGILNHLPLPRKNCNPQLGEIIPEELIGDNGWKVVKIYDGRVADKLEALRNLWSTISGCDNGFFDLISTIICDAVKESRKRNVKTKKPQKSRIFYNTSSILQEKRCELEKIKKKIEK